MNLARTCMAYLGFACLVNGNLALCTQWEENTDKAHGLPWHSASRATEACIHAAQLCLWVCWLTWLRCGLTLAESPGVVDVLLAHITHLSPLEALLREDMAPCCSELRTHREVQSDHSHNKKKKKRSQTITYCLEEAIHKILQQLCAFEKAMWRVSWWYTLYTEYVVVICSGWAVLSCVSRHLI